MKEPWTLSVGRVRRYTFTELAMVADGLLNANRGAPASLETGSQRDPVLGVSPPWSTSDETRISLNQAFWGNEL